MPAPLLSATRAWKLKKAPLNTVSDDAFELTTEAIPLLKPDEVLVQTLYLSNGGSTLVVNARIFNNGHQDPSQRAYIQKDADPERLYAPPIREGSVMVCQICQMSLSSPLMTYSRLPTVSLKSWHQNLRNGKPETLYWHRQDGGNTQSFPPTELNPSCSSLICSPLVGFLLTPGPAHFPAIHQH
jgi:NADPH-dependent curcumin reductase CurA